MLLVDNLLLTGQTAPDFELRDTNGRAVRLSDFHGKKIVVLAFLRGFF